MAKKKENKRFDEGLMKVMITVGIVFMVIMFIAGNMLNEIAWYFIGFFLGGGSAAFGAGGLLAAKQLNDALKNK